MYYFNITNKHDSCSNMYLKINNVFIIIEKLF